MRIIFQNKNDYKFEMGIGWSGFEVARAYFDSGYFAYKPIMESPDD